MNSKVDRDGEAVMIVGMVEYAPLISHSSIKTRRKCWQQWSKTVFQNSGNNG